MKYCGGYYMKKTIFTLLMFLFCIQFGYTEVIVSAGDYKKIYNETAKFGINSQEDVIITSDKLKIMVPKGQKVIVRIDINENGETVINISGTGFRNIEINGYLVSSTEKTSFSVNSKTGEIVVTDGYLTAKDRQGHIMFAAKNVPFKIDLDAASVISDAESKFKIINEITDNDERKQEQKDLSPSAPR